MFRGRISRAVDKLGETGRAAEDPLDSLILERSRRRRRGWWRRMLDNAVGNDAAQFESLHRGSMADVLYRVESWLERIFEAQEQSKKRERWQRRS